MADIGLSKAGTNRPTRSTRAAGGASCVHRTLNLVSKCFHGVHAVRYYHHMCICLPLPTALPPVSYRHATKGALKTGSGSGRVEKYTDFRKVRKMARGGAPRAEEEGKGRKEGSF